MGKVIIFNAGSFVYGAEKGLLDQIRALQDKFEIIVVLPARGPLEKRIRGLFPGVSIKIFPLPVLMVSLSPFYYINFFILSILNLLYFIFYIISQDIDIVCTNSLLLLFPGLVAKITKRRHIWYVREYFSSDLLNWALGLLVRCCSDKIVCQSEAIRTRLSFPQKTEVIYEPLDAGDYKVAEPAVLRAEFNLPEDAIVVSVISRIHPLKGQYEFIKEMEEALAKHKNLFIIIVGDVTPATFKNRLYKKRIKRLIEKNNFKNVLFLGFRSDIGRILSLSDICVFPFLRDEPFGIAAAEALCFGKATFFPKRGGLQEVYSIFKAGSEFDVKKIMEKVSFFEQGAERKTLSFSVPDILSFTAYKNRILPVFEN